MLKRLLAVWILISIPSMALAAYTSLSPSLKDTATFQGFVEDRPEKIQVIEFFSYGCHWCFRLEEPLAAWKKKLPEGVAFRQVPVVFHPGWRMLSKAYYTAEALEVLDKVHEPLFKLVHLSKSIEGDADIRRAFVQAGVDAAAFDSVYQSFSLNAKMQEANALMQLFKLHAVPNFIVVGGGGRLYETSTYQAGGFDELFHTLDTLIAKEIAASH